MRVPRFPALTVAATIIALAASASFAQSPPMPLPASDTTFPLGVSWILEEGEDGRKDWRLELGPMYDKSGCEKIRAQFPERYLCLELATAPWVASIKENLEENILSAVTQLPDDLAATEVVKTLQQRLTALEAEVKALRNELAAR